MPRVCIAPEGICTNQCPNRPTCTIIRRKLLIYFVATHPKRGVYVDAVICGLAKAKASALRDIPDGSENIGIAAKVRNIRINKGML